jgi:hypothetical protein
MSQYMVRSLIFYIVNTVRSASAVGIAYPFEVPVQCFVGGCKMYVFFALFKLLLYCLSLDLWLLIISLVSSNLSCRVSFFRLMKNKKLQN